MMSYSKAEYGTNPEDFINVTHVFNKDAYQDMMKQLSNQETIILDSETVGNDSMVLFYEQMALERQMEALLDAQPDFINTGLAVIEENKRLVKEYETYLKDKYQTKTVLMYLITPEHRDILRFRRKELDQAKETFAISIHYSKLMVSWKKLQTKIEEDKSGLLFHRNQLALLQIGTLDAKQFLIDPKLLEGNEEFKEFLRSRSTIIGTNLKFDLAQLQQHLGITFYDVDVEMFDIILAAKMVRSGLMFQFGLKALALELLAYDQSKEERVSNWLKRPLTSEQEKYSALDVITPGLIYHILKNEIAEKNLEEATKLQMDFLKVLTKMEMTGIYVDLKGTEKLIKEIEEKTESMRASLAAQLGDEVWFNAEKGHNEMKLNKDFGSFKVTLIQLKAYGKKHAIQSLCDLQGTSKGDFEDIEEQIDILDEITAFRSLLHTKENYCRAFFNHHVDGRVHSSFVQLQKEGTRMSSRQPNVQNIARPGVWERQKYDTYEEAVNSWTPKEKLRLLFIPAPGRKLYDADYGAIELCMIAYYSQDVLMLKALTEGVDLHALTANRLFGLGFTYEDLKDKNVIKEFKIKWGKERQIAKTFNFAVVYGGGPAKLLRQLRIEADIYDMKESKMRTMRDEWFALYTGVKSWQDETLHIAKTYGYCTTRLGREIYFNAPQYVFSKAFNTPIQASCYEGLQQAAIIFDKGVMDLEARNIIKPNSIQLVNLVHDEFVVEADDNINEESVNNLIKKCMIDGMQVLMARREEGDKVFDEVPVTVDSSRIMTWADK